MTETASVEPLPPAGTVVAIVTASAAGFRPGTQQLECIPVER